MLHTWVEHWKRCPGEIYVKVMEGRMVLEYPKRVPRRVKGSKRWWVLIRNTMYPLQGNAKDGYYIQVG